jgi:Fe-S oxidoreductase
MGIFSGLIKSNVVYFPGCATYYKFKENFELYKKIFSKLGINYRVIGKQICCGLPALEAGYEKEARKIARRNLEIFKEEGIISIMTNSPEAYKMFSEDYPELLPDWNLEVINTWDLISEQLSSKSRLIKHKAMESVTYHDSCYLGRYSGIYDEPRKILELLGYEVVEMNDFKKDSMCCGSCGGLAITNPELAQKVAKERILQAKRVGVSKIIVASMENYQLMKKAARDMSIEILELSEVLALALGIKVTVENDIEEEIDGETKIFDEVEANKIMETELKEEPIIKEDWAK